LRLYVEAAIDFPEEEINFLADSHIHDSLHGLLSQVAALCVRAQQGVLLDEGVNVVIAGRPNAGKSTLLNRLTGQDTAIVTPIAGTTRDIVKAQINLDGVVLNVIDTAGLRDTDDIIEQAGIRRALQAIELAALVLVVVDGVGEQNFDPRVLYPELMQQVNSQAKVLVVCNKIDRANMQPAVKSNPEYSVVYISAKTGAGIDLLRAQIKEIIGMTAGVADSGMFLARRRHLDALARAEQCLLIGKHNLEIAAGELLAEELKQAQLALSEITGQFTSDDLLGRIFSEFCIGK